MIAITQFMVQYLSGALDVSVFGEIPAQPPTSFAVVEKLGGGLKNHIAESTLRLGCFADTLAHAEDLSLTVQAAVEGMVALPEICSTEYGGSSNATASKKYRYDVIWNITHY